MTDLGVRLTELGDHLDLRDDDDIASQVLARLDATPAAASPTRFWLRRASPRASRTIRYEGLERNEKERSDVSARVLTVAAAVLVVLAAIAAVPSSRSAIADWFGLDGVEIEQVPDLSVPVTATPFDDAAPGTVVAVDGRDVLIASFEGRLEQPLIDKVLSSGSGIERVDVGGSPGLWIDGEPHEVAYLGPDGMIILERFAGNTLIWQDGDVIHRVEGFPSLAEALAYANGP